MKLLLLLWASCVALLPLCSGRSQVVTLTEDSWDQILTGEWMVEFYAPWCPACRALGPTWREFAEWTDDLNLDGVAQVDVTENPGLSGRFIVTALPMIFHVKNGEFRQYRGARDKDSFISFIEDKKYTELETLPAWKDPKSIQMTALSYFFKMSMTLRNVHTTITEEYGYPYWVSYAGFGLATIMLGAVLGLILVVFIDLVYPPQKAGQQPIVITQKKKNDDIISPDDEDAAEEVDGEEKLSEDSKEPAVRKRRAKKAD